MKIICISIILIIWILCTFLMCLTILPILCLYAGEYEDEWFYIAKKIINKLID
jgi:hypothetical protein